MKVVIFGATGMVGYGVLLEALDHPDITKVISVGRRSVNLNHEKLEEIEHQDFENFEPLADKLLGIDACFWCLGTASSGVDEATYTRITLSFTLAAASVLKKQNPDMKFCFVSGAGTDESSRSMWARVKGSAENALKHLEFRELYLFRPALIRSMRGAKPRGLSYRVLYTILWPFMPLLRSVGQATSTVEIGKAMVEVLAHGSEKRVLNSADINRLAA